MPIVLRSRNSSLEQVILLAGRKQVLTERYRDKDTVKGTVCSHRTVHSTAAEVEGI
jgi:hypothetical protein